MGALTETPIGLVIRPATRADVPALHALVERAYRGDSARAGWTHEADLLGGLRSDVVALTAAVDDPARTILVGFEGEALIGSVELIDRGGGVAYLGLLSVDPARQAAGFGRQLIAAAEAEAQARFGATSIEMTVIASRAELIAYYERRGYAHTGETRPFPYDVPPHERLADGKLTMIVLAKRLQIS